MVRRPPSSTPFPTRRSSDLQHAAEDDIAAIVAVDGIDAAVGIGRVSGNDAGHVGVAEVDLALVADRSEEHTSELQSRVDLVCRLLLEKKNQQTQTTIIAALC